MLSCRREWPHLHRMANRGRAFFINFFLFFWFFFGSFCIFLDIFGMFCYVFLRPLSICIQLVPLSPRLLFVLMVSRPILVFFWFFFCWWFQKFSRKSGGPLSDLALIPFKCSCFFHIQYDFLVLPWWLFGKKRIFSYIYFCTYTNMHKSSNRKNTEKYTKNI